MKYFNGVWGFESCEDKGSQRQGGLSNESKHKYDWARCCGHTCGHCGGPLRVYVAKGRKIKVGAQCLQAPKRPRSRLATSQWKNIVMKCGGLLANMVGASSWAAHPSRIPWTANKPMQALIGDYDLHRGSTPGQDRAGDLQRVRLTS